MVVGSCLNSVDLVLCSRLLSTLPIQTNFSRTKQCLKCVCRRTEHLKTLKLQGNLIGWLLLKHGLNSSGHLQTEFEKDKRGFMLHCWTA